MSIISPERLSLLISKLREENSRSTFLSCFPGDFKRSRQRLDLAIIEEFDKNLYVSLPNKALSGGRFTYEPDYKDELQEVDGFLIDKKLSSLLDYQTSISKEKGYNPIKLGYPILVQRSKRSRQTCISAPLFTWELSLKFDPKRQLFSIDFKDTVPEVNQSLIGLIQTGEISFDRSGLESFLKGYNSDQSLKVLIKSLFSQIQSDNPQIKAFLNEEQLLTKFPYKNKGDLQEGAPSVPVLEVWNSAILAKFEMSKAGIIKDLESFLEGIPEFDEFELPTFLYGADQLDPSQASIFDTLSEGKHVVLHGPPGTGKSKTITNIISAAVAKKLRVAVVCQKLAALNVIKENLASLGIDAGVSVLTNVTKGRKGLVYSLRDRYDTTNRGVLQKKDLSSAEMNVKRFAQAVETRKSNAERTVYKEKKWRFLVGAIAQKRRILADFLDEINLSDNKLKNIGKKGSLDELIFEIERIQHEFDSKSEYFEFVEHVNEGVLDLDIQHALQELASLVASLEQAKSRLDDKRLGLDSAVESRILELQNASNEHKILSDLLKEKLNRISLDQLSNEAYQSDFSPASLLFNLQTQLVNYTEKLTEMQLAQQDLLKFQEEGLLEVFAKHSFGSRIRKLFNSEYRFKHKRFRQIGYLLRSRGLYDLNDQIQETQSNIKSINDCIVGIQNYLTKHGSIDGGFRKEIGLKILEFEKAKDNPLNSEKTLSTFQGFEPFQKVNRELRELQSKFDKLIWLKESTRRMLSDSNLGLDFVRQLESAGFRIQDVYKLTKDIEATEIPIEWFKMGAARELFELYLMQRSAGEAFHEMELFNSNSLINSLRSAISSLQDETIDAYKLETLNSFAQGANAINRASYSFKRTFAKTGKHKLALKSIYERFPDEMKDLVPVHLTTPEVLATLYEGKRKVFDLIIFDEASQVEIQDAIGCMFKGKAIVVAGDEHQMPPSRYFQRASSGLDDTTVDDDIDQADIEVESLLEFCRDSKAFRSVFLDFHYRSEHHKLIAFSNSAIYSRLVVKPNSHEEYRPIQFHHCPNGIWRKQTNDAEIQKIREVLTAIPIDTRVPKILIGTLNSAQRESIRKALEAYSFSDDDFLTRFEQLKDHGLEIKNLENLQGDECDIVILSTGYGLTENGKFSRNYGQINRKGIGYRLINVLITRAKYKVHVVSSIPRKVYQGFEEELSSAFDRGLFHAYLAYSEAVSNKDDNRVGSILQTLRRHKVTKDRSSDQYSEGFFESPFEEEVYAFLRKHYDESEIELQEISDQFRIDMVLRPLSSPGLKIAIECDGASYHSGWANQLSDIHREGILSQSGFKFIRVWSSNWWRDDKLSGKELLNEIDSLIRNQVNLTQEIKVPEWTGNIDVKEARSKIQPTFDFDIEEDEEKEQTSNQGQAKAKKDSRNERKDERSQQILNFDFEASIEDDYVNDYSQVKVEIIEGPMEGKELTIRIVPRQGMKKTNTKIKYILPEYDLAKQLKWKAKGDIVTTDKIKCRILEVVQLD